MSEEQKNEKILSKKISIDIFINLLYGLIFMIYYLSLNTLERYMLESDFIIYIKYSCMIFLGIGIIAFESGYKKDKGKYWVHGIEFLVLSFYTLMIRYIVKVNQLTFEIYVTISSYVFSLYYILKCLIIYTRERKVYLKSLSDIKEIVKKDEPIKKEATKKIKKENTVENNSKAENKNIQKDNKKSSSKTNKEKSKEIEKSSSQKDKEKTKAKKEKSSTKKNETKKDKVEKNKDSKNKENKTNKNKRKEETIEEQNKAKQEEMKQETPKKRGRPRKEKQTV